MNSTFTDHRDARPVIEYDPHAPITDELIAEIAQHVTAAPINETLFVQGSTVVDVRERDDFTPYAVRKHLADMVLYRSVNFVQRRRRGGYTYNVDVRARLRDAVIEKIKPELSPLNAVARHPIVTPSGNVITHSGYDLETGVYVALHPALEAALNAKYAAPLQPTAQDVTDARATLERLLAHNAFDSPADFSRYCAAVLTVMMRSCFTGGPLVYCAGYAQRSDGYALAQEIGALCRGTGIATSVGPNIDELSRRCSHAWDEGETVLYNLWSVDKGRTAKTMREDLLAPQVNGRTAKYTQAQGVQNYLTLLYAQDDVHVSQCLRDVVLPVVLKQSGESQHKPNCFSDRALVEYQEYRAEFFGALLTLFRVWVDADQPAPQTQSDFADELHEWYFYVGGVLDHAGLPSIV